jgi:hypothetical protein
VEHEALAFHAADADDSAFAVGHLAGVVLVIKLGKVKPGVLVADAVVSRPRGAVLSTLLRLLAARGCTGAVRPQRAVAELFGRSERSLVDDRLDSVVEPFSDHARREDPASLIMRNADSTNSAVLYKGLLGYAEDLAEQPDAFHR